MFFFHLIKSLHVVCQFYLKKGIRVFHFIFTQASEFCLDYLDDPIFYHRHDLSSIYLLNSRPWSLFIAEKMRFISVVCRDSNLFLAL